MAGKRKLTEQEVEVCNFLNDLREEGSVNMFGAGANIQAEFGTDRNETRKLHLTWMQHFQQDGNYAELEIEDE